MVVDTEDPNNLVVIPREAELVEDDAETVNPPSPQLLTPPPDLIDDNNQSSLPPSPTEEDLELLTSNLPDDFWEDDIIQGGEHSAASSCSGTGTGTGADTRGTQRGTEKRVGQQAIIIEDWIQSTFQSGTTIY